MDEITLPEEGRKIFAQDSKFILSAPNLKAIPGTDLPEIAFAGRSNVGKSSLLNALLNRRTLARTSSTPGRTQALNFFQVGNDFSFVDMPGYGYAKISKSIKKNWDSLIRTYLLGRPTLTRVFLLIDARHGLKESDIDLMKMLDETAVSYQIVLTKGDKVKRPEQEKLVKKITETLKKHPAAFEEVILTSSEKKWGIDTLRLSLLKCLSLIEDKILDNI